MKNLKVTAEELEVALKHVCKSMTEICSTPFDARMFSTDYTRVGHAIHLMSAYSIPYAVIPAVVDIGRIWLIVYPRLFEPTLRARCGWKARDEVDLSNRLGQESADADQPEQCGDGEGTGERDTGDHVLQQDSGDGQGDAG